MNVYADLTKATKTEFLLPTKYNDSTHEGKDVTDLGDRQLARMGGKLLYGSLQLKWGCHHIYRVHDTKIVHVIAMITKKF